MISSENVVIPKYFAPILAENKKKIEIDVIDMKVSSHVIGLKIVNRFQMGETCEGYWGRVLIIWKIQKKTEET